MSSASLHHVKRSQPFALLMVASLVVSVVPAGAQEREVRTAQHAQAVDLFQQSRAAYRDGHFKEAADLLQRAYAVEPAPILLYNLARAYEGLGDLPHAVDAYQRYLKESPDAKDRGATEERIRTLTRQIEDRTKLEQERERERERARRAEQEQRDAPPPRPVSPVPWIVAGVGVATVGVGAAFGLMAVGTHKDAENARAQTDVDEKRRQAQTQATIANVCFVAGGVVAAGGIAWGLVSLKASSRAHAPSAEAWLGPASVGVRGAF